MRASRQSEWEREQGISRGVSGPGGTSRSQPKFDRSKSVRQEHGDQPQASFPQSLYKSNAAKQKSIIDSMSMGSLKEKLGRLCGKFFIYTNVPAYKAESHEYKNMIIGAQECPNVPPPSSFQIMNKYLPMEHKEITEYINSQRKMWKTYGCTIMADGWSGPTRMQVINFMVYCKGKTVFLKSVNASSDIREHKYLAKLFKDVIDEVGKENVVQICTDNGSAFVKAGKTLSERYNFYWTPCAAHCIDLMFEDIGKKKKVSDVITIARLVTVYIYNHGWVLALMRKICNGDLIRPGPTRFATNYISLQSLFQKKAGLKQLFTCDDWVTSKYSRSKEGRRIEELVLENMFWDNVQAVISIYEPLYGVLRIVDTEVNPTMPMLYDLFKKVRTKLEEVRNTVWVRKIIDDRWFKQLCHPLHAAAYYLNPMFQYSEGIGDDPELLDALHSVFAKLDPNSIGIAQFGNEIISFRDSLYGFGRPAAIAARKAMTTYEWWNMYGGDAPTLRKLAMKILSQTTSSSACERNWSTFALIHTKQRNRLAHNKLEQIVYCYYNMKLQLRDAKAAADRVAETNYLDLFNIAADIGAEETADPIYHWVRPLHLDDAAGNPDANIATHARGMGINVDMVMKKEVRDHSDESDGSGYKLSRGTSEKSIDDHDDDDDDDGDGGNTGGGSRYHAYGGSTRDNSCDNSSYDDTNREANYGNDRGSGKSWHYNQYSSDDHTTYPDANREYNSRARDTQGRRDSHLSLNEFESLSSSLGSMDIGTQSSDHPNPFHSHYPHHEMSSTSESTYRIGSSSQGGSTYGLFDHSSSQMPHASYNETPYWVIPQFPIYGLHVGRDQHTYITHVMKYQNHFQNSCTWEQYCMILNGSSSTTWIEPHRSSSYY
ncbi:hypothetical protein ABKV19_008328 [Rosa sericea]